ncbi:hypothetical protein MDV014.5 [Gallid alphaherpesvirus 2]|uniref:Uncharacterized protein n=1 Tax=Gallid alphaherpesvirus 2 TaxID=10390 RepID=Q19BF3_9ALPH|nr:hypothetical protein MDV014.5 [Gallid alphaherpesvirus 2]ACF49616.1 hypothetical protein MDV014.5 [synthetic construct]ABR13077.1 hypothetical protein MDV014.5 [Gallid alphaherpesvirus 2]ACF94904.1 hypothetical protein MDV014.5 [Gallid alphaherpesvirus 2]ACR02800.1 hypothetical protein MDV014.5 [synthetic construct]
MCNHSHVQKTGSQTPIDINHNGYQHTFRINCVSKLGLELRIIQSGNSMLRAFHAGMPARRALSTRLRLLRTGECGKRPTYDVCEKSGSREKSRIYPF